MVNFSMIKRLLRGPSGSQRRPDSALVGKRVVIAAEQLHTGLSFRHHDTPRPLCSDTATGTVDHRYSASGRRTKPRPRRDDAGHLAPVGDDIVQPALLHHVFPEI